MEQDICFHVFLWQIVTKPIGTKSIKVKLTLCIKDNKSMTLTLKHYAIWIKYCINISARVSLTKLFKF